MNFEKLRMMAKEIRHVGRMAAVNMDPALMFRTRYVCPEGSQTAPNDPPYPWAERLTCHGCSGSFTATGKTHESP